MCHLIELAILKIENNQILEIIAIVQRDHPQLEAISLLLIEDLVDIHQVGCQTIV